MSALCAGQQWLITHVAFWMTLVSCCFCQRRTSRPTQPLTVAALGFSTSYFVLQDPCLAIKLDRKQSIPHRSMLYLRSKLAYSMPPNDSFSHHKTFQWCNAIFYLHHLLFFRQSPEEPQSAALLMNLQLGLSRWFQTAHLHSLLHARSRCYCMLHCWHQS